MIENDLFMKFWFFSNTYIWY